MTSSWSDQPAPAGRFSRASWQLSPPTRRLLIVLMLAVLLGVLGSWISIPYVVYRPGATFNALGSVPGGQTPMVSVSGAPTYPTTGTLDITTVALYGGPGAELNVWDGVRFVVQGADFVERDKVFPRDATRDDVKRVNQAEMVVSQREAVAVALRATGHPVSEQIVVAHVEPRGPAADRLRVGDVLLSVNGTSIVTAADVPRLVQNTPTGSAARLQVRRDDQQTTVLVTPVQVEGRQRLLVGIDSQFSFPLKVTINAGDVGGPSAGLMFALAVYDKLTRGPLTGGQRIAGTGTIGSDGAIGAIGGIEYKMTGASAVGAQWFLAPAANCSDVVGREPEGLQVVKVTTFTEAVNAVERIAAGTGQALPGCSVSR